MKTKYQPLLFKNQFPFIVKKYETASLHSPTDDSWGHFHTEYEIHWVTKGEGIRYIGDRVERFHPGEVVLLGPNLPHLWMVKKAPDKKNHPLEYIVIHFDKELLGSALFDILEMRQIEGLLKASEKGILVGTDVRKKIQDLMERFLGVSGVERVLTLLKLLQLASESEQNEIISTWPVKMQDYQKLCTKIKTVMDYVAKHLDQEIHSSDLAEITHLTPVSFSRYFTKATQIYFSQYVKQMRVLKACQLLVDTEDSITDIAYSCGFKSLTNFNRQFSELKQTTPRQFRKNFTLLPN